MAANYRGKFSYRKKLKKSYRKRTFKKKVMFKRSKLRRTGPFSVDSHKRTQKAVIQIYQSTPSANELSYPALMPLDDTTIAIGGPLDYAALIWITTPKNAVGGEVERQ